MFKLTGLALYVVLFAAMGVIFGIGREIWYYFLGGRVLEEERTRREQEDVDQALANMRGSAPIARRPTSLWVRVSRVVQVLLPIGVMAAGVYLLVSD